MENGEKKVSIDTMVNSISESIRDHIKDTGEMFNCLFFVNGDEGVSEPQPFVLEDGKFLSSFYAAGWEAKGWGAHEVVIFMSTLAKRIELDQMDYVKENLETESPLTYPESMLEKGIIMHRFSLITNTQSATIYMYDKKKDGSIVFSEPVTKHSDELGTFDKFAETIRLGYSEYTNEKDQELRKSGCVSCEHVHDEIPGLLDFGSKIINYQDKVSGLFDMDGMINDLSKTIIDGFQEANILKNIAFIGHCERGITPPVIFPKIDLITVDHMIMATGSMCKGADGDEIVMFLNCAGIKIPQGKRKYFEENLDTEHPDLYPDSLRNDGILEVRYFVNTDTSVVKYHLYKKDDKGNVKFTKTIKAEEIVMANIIDMLKKGMEKFDKFMLKLGDGSVIPGDDFTSGPNLDDHLKNINPEDFVP